VAHVRLLDWWPCSSGGGDLAEAATAPAVLHPDPATTPVTSPPFPKNLTDQERPQLKTFDELDFDVFSHADWARLGESHAKNIRVHWPDGHFTDGIDRHIADLSALFVWAPDTRIETHPIRISKNEMTAVTGVMLGTFSRPMPDGKGGFIPPNFKKYASTCPPSGSSTASWTRSSSSGTTRPSTSRSAWPEPRLHRPITAGENTAAKCPDCRRR
jgi:hypothetical protein